VNFNETQLEAFGNALSTVLMELRKEAGISQNELAWRAGLSQQHIGYLEKGTRMPSAISLKRIALALNIRLCEIVKRAETLGDRQSRGD
jgi:transcriptional regulator with XRE-family HTH domain